MTAGALRRRQLLATGAVGAFGTLGTATALGVGGLLIGCEGRAPPPPLQGGWVGARHERGHRLRTGQPPSWPTARRHAAVLIVGGGIAGLAAARGFLRRGIADVQLLELEDQAGGNARGHQLAGMACPLGAHYLPVPAAGAATDELSEWLHEIGLLRMEAGRPVPDERHLCHSPQERLFIAGHWVDGLLPPAEPGSRTLEQYRRFAALVTKAQGPAHRRAFTLPAHRAPWTAATAALDSLTFAGWLAREGLDDARLLGYLDYGCRDDYGAGLATVSAWAGLHYFASRHGFHAPGDGEPEREGVFTWPEGNRWLADRLAAPLGERLHTARTVLAVRETRQGVEVLAHDEARDQPEAWLADTVVMAVPLFVASHLLQQPAPALRAATSALSHAPWLVANLHLTRPLLDRPGAGPAWDNVIHGSAGLGYVDAMHQSLRPYAGPTVLTAYQALPVSERAALLAPDWQPWAERVLRDLQGAHPDLRERVGRIELMRWGHAMAIPRPGLQRHAALQALRTQRGRLRFAHSDLAGYSVFEEAFTAGCEAAAAPGR